MKNVITFSFVFLLVVSISIGQTWTQRADYGGTARQLAVAAVVGNCAYVGTGDAGLSEPNSKAFWKYDATTNSWVQLTDFPGTGRRMACAFAIGTNVYVGTGATYDGGSNYTCFSDFWEFNTITLAWTQKASFSGGIRRGAFAFSVDNYGYIGGGLNNSGTYVYDLWRYNPGNDSWTPVSNFPGDNPFCAATFVIGDYAYVCTGNNGSSYKNGLWQYNPMSDSWIQKTNFTDAIGYAVGFSLDQYGYICTGFDGSDENNDLWQYNNSLDSWTQLSDLTGGKRRAAIGFAINNRGYVGTGYDHDVSANLTDMWEYTPSWWGIEGADNSNSNFRIFPNPAYDILNIEMINSSSVDVTIYNVQGQVQSQKKLDAGTNQLNIGALANGLYIVKLVTSEGVWAQKFLKE